jgi:WD40 repeat protein
VNDPTAAAEFVTSPYPGLRPFQVDEIEIFFGREEQTDQLLNRLQRSRFLAIVGPSGCGKSSLVRAGLMAALHTGLMAGAGSHWRIAHMRPGDRPLWRLAEALAERSAFDLEQDGGRIAVPFADATLRRGPLGLVELLEEGWLPRGANLLLLVDQFEEIFRFRQEGNADEADAFVALLLATAAHVGFPVYVVLTMRSDFLGECALFHGLPEAINEGQYLTPRMTREQIRSAIVGPARVFDANVEPALEVQLLNEVGADPDQLPLLQHALLRMWQHMRARVRAAGALGAPIEPRLLMADYAAVGSIARALSAHADQVYDDLSPAQQRIAELMFRRLTHRATGKRDTRRPARLGDVAAVAGAAHEEVTAVVEEFRRSDRSFVTPPVGVPLTADTILDIGHESLIRQWNRLNEWVDAESRSADTYWRLADSASRERAGRAALWRSPDLDEGLAWREHEAPNAAWAARYGTAEDFDRAIQFLDRSADQQRAEIEARERALREREDLERQRREERERRLEDQARSGRKFRWLSYALAGVVLLALAAAVVAWRSERRARDSEMRALVSAKHARDSAEAALVSENRAKDSALAAEQLRIAEQQAREQAEAALKTADSEKRRAETQAALARARQLNIEAEAAFDDTGNGLVSSVLLLLGSLTSAWTPEGHDALVRRMDLLPPAPVTTWRAHAGEVRAMALTPDRRWLATAGPGHTRLQTAVAGTAATSLAAQHHHYLHAVAFSPDGRWLATGCDEAACIHGADGATRWQLARRLPHGMTISSLGFSPDGKRLALAGYASSEVKVYETDTWAAHVSFDIADDSVWALEFSPDGRWLATLGRSTVKLWRPAKHGRGYDNVAEIKLRAPHRQVLAFSPKRDVLAVGTDGALQLLAIAVRDDETIQLVAAPTPLAVKLGQWSRAAFTVDGRYVAVTHAERGAVRVVHVDTGREVTRIPHPAVALAFSDQRRLLTGNLDGTIVEWEAAEKAARRLPHERAVRAVAFSMDGRRLATASGDDVLRIFDTSTWNEVQRLRHPTDRRGLAFSPDGRWLVATTQGRLSLVDATAWRIVSQLAHEGPIATIAFSPDGRSLATTTEADGGRYGVRRPTTVRVWDIATAAQLAWTYDLEGDRKRFTSIAARRALDTFSSRGGGDRALLARAASWLAVRTGDGSSTADVIVPNKPWLTSVTAQGVKLSEAVRQRARAAHEGDVIDVAFSGDGRLLASVGADQSARIWHVVPKDLVSDACARLPRNLTCAEWRASLGDSPYRTICPALPDPPDVAACGSPRSPSGARGGSS